MVCDFPTGKQQDNKELPERDKHHHFDTQEFAHWFNWTQFLSQSPVEQHQAVHGKLDPVQTEEKSNTDIHHFTTTLNQRSGLAITSWDMLLKMTR